MFDRFVARYVYRDRICDAIVAAKFGFGGPVAVALADELAETIDNDSTSWDPEDPPVITFVPSHRFRRMARGGGGTEIMADRLARQLSLAMRPTVRLTRRIKKQAWLDDAGRRANLAGAFTARRSLLRRPPTEVWLVDDVLTTGATATEIIRVLHDAGVARTRVAVVARAVRNDAGTPKP